MSELGPDTRALLDAARDAHEPSAADRARIRGRIATRIGAAAFGTTVAVTAMSSTARTAAKIGIGVAVGGVLLAIGMWRSSHEVVPPPPPATDPPVAVAPAPAPKPALLDKALDPVPVESLAPAPTIATAEKKVAPAPTDKPEPQSTLDAELALLQGAKKALNDGDAARSLAILDEHQRKFPNGILVEERASTRIFALCAAGRTPEAQTSAQDFLAKYPRSPSAPRVRASCGAPAP